MPGKISSYTIVRVIAGSAKGIHLSSVKGSKTRPIPDRVKESLFNILAGVIPDSRVLDMYAGTGAIGIEALSRGAESCIFIENDRQALQIIKKNLEQTKLQTKAWVLPYDVFEITPFLEKNHVVIDVIFASPPYPFLEKKSYRDNLLTVFSSLYQKHILLPDGLIVLQHRKTDSEQTPKVPVLEVFDARTYGDTQISFFRNAIQQEHSL
ncbi:MAG: 16S rRNA (guanine(966)-N(2))-methyltransferase RsmD [Candidatus Brocadia sp. BROELEC01]|nr:16S rRNA (guanine(966)-N(2))-methyltransferase RsmD [Candidatus Brocadia sapporoensis]OQZ01210.1 MAG: 16S rRNA (guanine(966)-N(2))-methyltransferase RsmD [Candidatus Brocadia sp. UTAMX1]QQR66160.1 MAG: 16S rRNA (guanine(966)-N(2))-methyltransferase RsmD [Candidatus Brocadia sp.]RZV56547.1 MAG: 16S rRNA (guanine(966)-N(2))-methyltransferase RsmD [Candidatus Brocadia sp. BROELEC01]